MLINIAFENKIVFIKNNFGKRNNMTPNKSLQNKTSLVFPYLVSEQNNGIRVSVRKTEIN